MVHPYSVLFEKETRTVLGIMSGTSLDAIDVAAVRLGGTGKDMTIDVLGTEAIPISDRLRELILANSEVESSDVRQLTLLHSLIAHRYDSAIRRVLPQFSLTLDQVDVIGIHGQTVYHQPQALELDGTNVAGTTQLGDPSVLANLTRCAVVGDFRTADIALGGQGAPLVPYFDYVCFGDEAEDRLILNLGGIANLTVLPAGCSARDVLAFDTGPANMVIDNLTRRLFDRAFDENGGIAARGSVNEGLMEFLLAEPYFSRKPPKSTGRELFSSRYSDAVVRMSVQRGMNNEDIIATVTELSVRTILRAWQDFISSSLRLSRVLVAGGGLHNRTIMDGLERGFHRVPVSSTESVGIPPDAREAICFAVLAHEALNGTPANMPSATGASRATILGKICMPG
jgi:anhydro-N-acetylmuramic acid kinase